VSTLEAQSTESRETVPKRQYRWLQPWWVIIGLGFDWRCAFEWLAGKSPFYSAVVLGRAGLIALGCAAVALFFVSIIRGARWRHALPLFCLFSMTVYRILSTHWIAQRR